MHGADVGATGAAAKELDALQKRRADLYQQIVDQVKREATRIAKERGFTIVFVNVFAARRRLRYDQRTHQRHRKPTRVKNSIHHPHRRSSAAAARRLRRGEARSDSSTLQRIVAQLAGVSELSEPAAGRRADHRVRPRERGERGKETRSPAEQKYAAITEQLTQQIRDAAAKIARQSSCKLVVTREGVGYGGVDITTDVEKALNITEKATPTPGL